MPKKDGKKSKDVVETIRNVDLHPDAKKLLEKHISFAEKHNLGKEEEIMDMFYGVFEAGDKLAEALNSRGVDDRYAQLQAVDSVKAQLGRKVVKPKYGLYFKPINIRTDTIEDEKVKGKTYEAVFTFGQAKIINLKNDMVIGEKFVDISAWREDAKKIEGMEENQTYYLEAATGNITPNVVTMTVDDRCKDAELSKEKLTNMEKLQTTLFDITPINRASELGSANPRDVRLVEGRINYVSFPKKKNYAIVELTDTSVLLDDLEKNKSKANLRCFVNKELITKIGKDSVVRMLGEIRVSSSEQYGESTTLFFPPMIYPIIHVEPEEEKREISDDNTENMSDYMKKKVGTDDDSAYATAQKEVPTFQDEKAEDSDSDESNEESEDEAEEEIEDELFEEEKSEPEKLDKAPKEEPDTDIYLTVKDHPCVKAGNFGFPSSTDEESEDFDGGCLECYKTEPEVYNLCLKKADEIKNK